MDQLKTNGSSDVVLNYNIDLGAMVVEDCQNYSGLTKDQMMVNTQKNLAGFFSALFDLKKQQKLAAGGEDGEILEYDKSKFSVVLPKSAIVLPREKPIPKEKPLTKWEKFRIEKGLGKREKRSRMVYDPITKDYVPRYGMGSIKKIEEKYNWVMEEKPKHVESGIDPFTFKKNEKKLTEEKQNLRELKNKIVTQNPAGNASNKDQILDPMSGKTDEDTYKTKKQQDGEIGKTLKLKDDQTRANIKKREKKSLMKSLQLAQISTGSMGKFDRKANKFEPNAPNSQVKPKKKSNKKIYDLEKSKSVEKDRNMKILSLMQKEKDLRAQGKLPK